MIIINSPRGQTFLYACDLKWWDWHSGAPEFNGRKITQDEKAAARYGLEYIESRPELYLSTDPNVIHQGSNSGFQAINLAYNLGAERIILLGYDMMFTKGESHWFGDHPDKVRSSYDVFIRNLGTIAEQAPKLGLEIINCTRTTALHCFTRMNLESVL